MFHILKYRFLCMIRNRSLMFWTLMFPIILATLFSSVLTHVFDDDKIKTIPIAIVKNEAYQKDKTLQAVVKEVSLGEQKLFAVKETTQEEAKRLLANDSIQAYILCGDQIEIKVDANGTSQTIVQSFFDEYKQKEAMVTRMVQHGATPDVIEEAMNTTTSFVKDSNTDNSDIVSVYFYTILAMNAMFGSYWSIRSTYEIQANQCTRAARISMTPIHKEKALFLDFILNMACQLFFLLLQFCYMFFLLKVDFGVHLPQIFLTIILGTFAGNGFGVLIGTVINKIPVSGKISVATGIVMACSFLAGMMMLDVRYLVQVHVPILNMINPVNMITDALYALYYFGIGERFYFNLISLVIFAFVCYGVGFLFLRKKAYDSLEVR